MKKCTKLFDLVCKLEIYAIERNNRVPGFSNFFDRKTTPTCLVAVEINFVLSCITTKIIQKSLKNTVAEKKHT